MPTHPVGTVVQLRNGDLFLITRHNPSKPKNCYSGVNVNGNGTEYIFGEINVVKAIDSYDTSRVRLPQDKHDPSYANRMANSDLTNRNRWIVLGGLKPGDKFEVRLRSGVQTVTLIGINPNARRYPVEIEDAKGCRIRTTIGAVVVKPVAGTPERSSDEGIFGVTPEGQNLSFVTVGRQFNLLINDSFRPFTVERIAFTPFGTMARLAGETGNRYMLVADIAKGGDGDTLVEIDENETEARIAEIEGQE